MTYSFSISNRGKSIRNHQKSWGQGLGDENEHGGYQKERAYAGS
ncbi:hypothetical protein BAOM_0846 [Peribacillus asahii]|uniref:Uncharacterized protein n=1 Tax=Peribacillus asahii TaxID=228899 RepID=A0A3Q9RKM6_9BACI|nr:hypothetical protein BAOM_0846 [Peribacillus asahii]